MLFTDGMKHVYQIALCNLDPTNLNDASITTTLEETYYTPVSTSKCHLLQRMTREPEWRQTSQLFWKRVI